MDEKVHNNARDGAKEVNSAPDSTKRTVESCSLHKMGHTAPRRSPVELMMKILTITDGRDKTFKLIQYTSRLILRVGSTKPLRMYLDRSGLARPLNPLISQLSMFRKIIRLGNWMSTLHELSEEWNGFKKLMTKDMIVLLIDLYTEIFDDIYCLGKMGVVKNKQLQKSADEQAIKGWFYSIIFGLHGQFIKYQEIQHKIRELKRQNGGSMTCEQNIALKEEIYASRINTTKMVCDFIFCGIDYFELDVDPIFQIVSGLASGILGYHKLYRKVAYA